MAGHRNASWLLSWPECDEALEQLHGGLTSADSITALPTILSEHGASVHNRKATKPYAVREPLQGLLEFMPRVWRHLWQLPPCRWEHCADAQHAAAQLRLHPAMSCDPEDHLAAHMPLLKVLVCSPARHGTRERMDRKPLEVSTWRHVVPTLGHRQQHRW